MNVLRRFMCLALVPLSVALADGPDNATASPGNPLGDVLHPGRASAGLVWHLGFDVGLNYAAYSGTQVITFVNPIAQADGWSAFDGGNGLGFIVDGVVDLSLSDHVGLVAKLGYIQRVDKFSGAFVDPVFLRLPSGALAPATLDGKLDLTTSFFNFDFLLRYQLAPKSWYFLGGVSVSSLLSSDKGNLEQRIVSPDNTFYLDQFGQLTNFTSFALSDLTVSGYKKTRVALKAGIGTWIPLGTSVFLTPELTADYALNPFLKADGIVFNGVTIVPNSDARFLTISLTAGLRFAL
ncbi:MAG: outer membrane beta-barrel protein [Ignavibacteria bacterium]|nr:outer membrane beta-barrel protein [Ignavibacteria bacterium]